jgi:hypothetical protein
MASRPFQRRGAADLTWTLVDPAMQPHQELLHCVLAAILYARMLIIHKDGGALFGRVQAATEGNSPLGT